jgi:hypothetical protein
MTKRDWNDPRLRKIGRQFAADAYEIALDLKTFGADAAVFVLPKAELQKLADRPIHITIPTRFADMLMALLLSLPRSNIERTRNWSPRRVQASMDRGMSLRAAAKKEAERAGKPAELIRRRMLERRAKKKSKSPKR